MPSYVQLTDRLTDQVVAGLERAEGVVSTSTTNVAGRNPALPLARKLPLVGKLPSVREMTAANFTALERIVSAQKEYALSVLSSTAPASSAPAAKPATTATRARATSRKTS